MRRDAGDDGSAAAAIAAQRRSPDVRALDGMTWKGLALIALLCVVNAVRRQVMAFGPDTVAMGTSGALDWLAATGVLARNGMIVAAPVAFAVVAAYNLTPPRPWIRYGVLAFAVVASSLAGVLLSFASDFLLYCPGDYTVCDDDAAWLPELVAAWTRYGALCALFTVVFVYLRIADESGARAREADVARTRFVQRMAEARLRMLQAQIEPHFLFNTLANVRRLYRIAPADAATMLDHLMHYLEVALPQMREGTSTLAREASLTRSYLELQRIRMGARLDFQIAIPDALGAMPLPPMMLVTLAENAIKHGLAPLPEGGTLRIGATLAGDELEVRVADTGQGFTQSAGGGTGLANIHARLRMAYGRAGRLTLVRNAPRGVVATIAVPVARAGAAA